MEFVAFHLKTSQTGAKSVIKNNIFFKKNRKNAPNIDFLGLKNFSETLNNFPESLNNFSEGLNNFPEGLKNFPENLNNFSEGLKNFSERLNNFSAS